MELHKHSNKNIVIVRFISGSTILKEDANLIIDEVKKVIGVGCSYFAVSDIENKVIMTPKARYVFANSAYMKENLKGNAVVIPSKALKMVYDFFVKFNKPSFPIKSFNSVEASLNWIVRISNK